MVDFNDLFLKNKNKQNGLLVDGMPNNTYNNTQKNYEEYQSLIQPLLDAKSSSPYQNRNMNPAPSSNFVTPDAYPEYVDRDLSGFQKIQSLFGYNFPSQQQRRSVYDMVNNLSEAELSTYYLDPKKFKENYMNKMFAPATERQIITDSDGRQRYADNLELVMPFEKKDLNQFEVDGILYDYNTPDPDSPTGYAQVSSTDKPNYSNLQDWQITQLNLYDEQEKELFKLPEDSEERIKGLRDIENGRRIILGDDEEVKKDYNVSGGSNNNNTPFLEPVDKNWSIGDRNKWNEVASKSALSMSNAMQVKDQFNPTFLETSGKSGYLYNAFLEKASPSMSIARRNETFEDTFGNTYMNALTGKPMTKGEMYDEQALFYANSLQAQNSIIRDQTGAVMNINETTRILKSMPDTGLASPDAGGISGIPTIVLGGDSPYQFAIKQDDVMIDLGRTHLRTNVILQNRLSQPDISVESLTLNGKTVTLAEWHDLPREEKIKDWEVKYVNPEEVGEFRETPYKWSGGLWKDGSEMTLDSIWQHTAVKRNGMVTYPSHLQKGFIPDEINRKVDEVMANEDGSYDMYMRSITKSVENPNGQTLQEYLNSNKTDKQKRNVIFYGIAYPIILQGYGLQPDNLPYNGSGLVNVMNKYQRDNTKKN